MDASSLVSSSCPGPRKLILETRVAKVFLFFCFCLFLKKILLPTSSIGRFSGAQMEAAGFQGGGQTDAEAGTATPRAVHQDQEAAEGRECDVRAGSRSTCLFLDAETALFSKQGRCPCCVRPWVGPWGHRGG